MGICGVIEWDTISNLAQLKSVANFQAQKSIDNIILMSRNGKLHKLGKFFVLRNWRKQLGQTANSEQFSIRNVVSGNRYAEH